MKKIIYILLFAVLPLAACKKEAGFGGNALIKGKVIMREYNSAFTILLGQYAAVDKEVYIVAGGDISPTKKVVTDYKGEFSFPYLYKGKYTVYTYSKDSTQTTYSGDTSVVKMVEITNSRETKDIGTMVIH